MLADVRRLIDSIALAGEAVKDHTYSAADQLLWVRFENTASPRELVIKF